MYTIGEIAKITEISINTLRYYDDIGLLKPIKKNNDNNYRYYSENQVKDLSFILELKEYGFTLRKIKELMDSESKDKLKAELEEKRFHIFNEIEKLNRVSSLLEKRINSIDSDVKNDSIGRKRILIVDDVKFMRHMLKNIFEEYGYRVVGEACNGEQAVKLFEELKPDLITMDIYMPKMDGIDAAKAIFQKDRNAKIVVCSARNYIPVILDSFEVGVSGFVAKPFYSQDIVESIEKALKSERKMSIIKEIDEIKEFIKNNELEAANKIRLDKELMCEFNEIVLKGKFIEKCMERFLQKLFKKRDENEEIHY